MTEMKNQKVLMKKGDTENKSSSILDRIEHCERNQRIALDISSLSLSMWPDEVSLMDSIKILEAQNNQLSHIPSLETFRSLVELNLSRNKLTDILGLRLENLINLRKLNLSRNQLHTLPPVITKIFLLEVLIIDRNQIKEIPHDMSELKELRVFEASYNNITEVGDAFDNNPKIDELNLSFNNSLKIENMGERTRRLHEKVTRCYHRETCLISILCCRDKCFQTSK
jgi:Leucine-rich repeat (LRR) protein